MQPIRVTPGGEAKFELWRSILQTNMALHRTPQTFITHWGGCPIWLLPDFDSRRGLWIPFFAGKVMWIHFFCLVWCWRATYLADRRPWVCIQGWYGRYSWVGCTLERESWSAHPVKCHITVLTIRRPMNQILRIEINEMRLGWYAVCVEVCDFYMWFIYTINLWAGTFVG